jgi:biopolymer transport protein ExbB
MQDIFQKLSHFGDAAVLWVLVASSVLSLGVIMERWWAFHKRRLDFPTFLDQLSLRLEKGDALAARTLAAGNEGLESRVALAGLQNLSKGPASVEEAMTSRLVLERSVLEKNLIILGTLGNNAPFIGLFGTVLGIMKAFNDLAVSGQAGVGVVMAGISAALIATAFGILVAIPAVAANNYFVTRLRRSVSNAQSLIHLLQVYMRDENQRSLKERVKERGGYFVTPIPEEARH